jgi:hypothetical protein
LTLAIKDEHDVRSKQDEVHNTLEKCGFSSTESDYAGKKGERKHGNVTWFKT